MLTRECFKRQMEKLRKVYDSTMAMGNAFESFGCRLDDFPGYYAIDIAIEAIAVAMGEPESDLMYNDSISYYIYDLEWGENGKDCITDENGCAISLCTYDDLYYYLVSKNEKTAAVVTADVNDTEDEFDVSNLQTLLKIGDSNVPNLELVYNGNTTQYELYVEVAYGENALEKYTVYQSILMQFHKWMKDNGYKTDYVLSDNEVLNGSFDSFDSVEEAFAWYEMIVKIMLDRTISACEKEIDLA